MNIPLIIPNYNLLTYTKNLINWYRWYDPLAPVYIVDNGSNYEPLLNWYNSNPENIIIARYKNNTFIPNLTDFIRKHPFPYYVISDPDIMPHPATPVNFMEIWKNEIDNNGYHRAGFNLITSDLPQYLNEREMIIGNERDLLNNPVCHYFQYTGYRAPIDTTFCLYRSDNGGWSAPMEGRDWGRCLRLFDAFHLGWYIDPDNVNIEMDHYFTNSRYRIPGEPSAGANNNRPKQYQK